MYPSRPLNQPGEQETTEEEGEPDHVQGILDVRQFSAEDLAL